MKNVRLWLSTALAAIGIFVVFFYTSLKTPYYADDFGNRSQYYANAPLAAGENPSFKSFVSVPDCISSVATAVMNHYLHETGRFQSALWLKLLNGMPRWMASFACACALMWILYCVWRYSGLPETWIAPCMLATAGICLCPDAAYWLSGAANYLVPTGIAFAGLALFASRRLGESAFCMRNFWMPVLVPVGAFLGGGHELISIPVCLTFAVYWVVRMAERRFSCNGRFLLSVGFGIGSLLLVFSPSTIGRAGGVAFFTPDSQLLFSVARKLMVLARLCFRNPLLIAVLPLAAIGLFRQDIRQRTTAAHAYTVLFFFFTFSATCLLGGGGGRMGWPMSIASAMLTFSTLGVFNAAKSGMTKRVFAPCVSLIGVAVLVCTCISTTINHRIFERLMANWKSDPYGIFLLDDLPVRPRFGWFDRSTLSLVKLGVGDPWENAEFARIHGRNSMIGLYKTDRDCIFAPLNAGMIRPLKNVRGWFEIPGRDLLCSYDVPDLVSPGTRVQMNVEYDRLPPRLDIWRRIKNRLTRNGWASFSLCSPTDEMSKGIPLNGAIMDTPNGRCCILLHNHSIPRDSIKSISPTGNILPNTIL